MAAYSAISWRSNGAIPGAADRERGLAHRVEGTALAIGVGGLVQRIERTQEVAAARIDQIDAAQIPARVAQMHALQMPVAGGNLEALPVQADRAVAAALGARELPPEGRPQPFTARAFAPDIGAGEVTLERAALRSRNARCAGTRARPRRRWRC